MDNTHAVIEGLRAAQSANPNNFKHSEVRKIKRGFFAAVEQISELTKSNQLLSAASELRSTADEL